jgi:uncharacterized protein YndB with AHSA1/START domain
VPTEEAGSSFPSSTDPVECEVRIAAAPETVFPFFTDPELMTRWQGSAATLDPRPGGIYRVDVIDGHVARGEFVEVDPPRRVVFTFGWEPEGGGDPVSIEAGSSTIEIVLTPDGDETVVRLIHRDLPEAARDGHRMGWVHYLERLAVAAPGGDPGPDRGLGEG